MLFSIFVLKANCFNHSVIIIPCFKAHHKASQLVTKVVRKHQLTLFKGTLQKYSNHSTQSSELAGLGHMFKPALLPLYIVYCNQVHGKRKVKIMNLQW